MQKKRKGLTRRERREAAVAYACLAPTIVGLLCLTVIPLGFVVYISMTKWTAISRPSFVGLANYVKMFSDPYIYISIKATLSYAVGAIFFSLIYALAIAIILNTTIPLRGMFRSVFFLPYVVPSIGVTMLWAWIFNPDFGLMNSFTSLFGFDKSLWIFGENTAIPSLWIMAVWGAGNYIVIFLAGLQGVPKTLLEAVSIDGGNAIHKLFHVTLPMITPTIFFNFLMGMINHLQNFVPVYTITKGGPNNATLFTVYYLVREAFTRNNFGYASAIAVIFFLIVAAITALIFVTSNKWVYYGGE